MKTKRKIVNIRVAFDTILYSPLYTFVQNNSLDDDSRFLFRIKPVHEPIRPVASGELKALAPIDHDPVFSEVIHKDNFQVFENDWFGVADPLRVRRLLLHHTADSISFDFVGTFVDELAFWLITESHCQVDTNSRWKYNYVACQSKGMTGYYLAERIFTQPKNNPLAPSKLPGHELIHFFDLLKADDKRKERSVTDPVWLAAVSTEIGKIIYMKGRYGFSDRFRDHYIPNIFPELAPKKFLLTAIVARKYTDSQQDEVNEAVEYLKKKLQEEILRLQSRNPNTCRDFLEDLIDFYWGHASFELPGNGRLFGLRRNLETSLKQLSTIYTQTLAADPEAKTTTDAFLKEAIKSDLTQSTGSAPAAKVTRLYQQLQTDTWGKGLW